MDISKEWRSWVLGFNFKPAPDTSCHENTMSSFFPPEILDLIVDHLHDEQTTLRACCLVSKSWVPRTRIHLFNCVSFSSSGPTLKSWMQTFPDPSNSPTRYTRILHLSDFKAVTVAISDARPWVQSFNHIVDLRVVTIGLNDPHISFNQLRRLSPTLKSLQLFCSFAPLPEILDCVCSFPLLEDLSLCSVIPRVQENVTKWNAPPTSPKFTGSLFISCKNRDIARELLALPGGLHFSKLTVVCPIGDGNLSKELVSACSDTLKSLTVDFYRGAFSLLSVADQYLISPCRYAQGRGTTFN